MHSKNGGLKVVGLGGTLREGSTSLGALRRALEAARETGAETELLDLRALNLPFYEPGKPLEEYEQEVESFVEAVRGADALRFSTAAYHGTLAGVTKNALNFTQFLARDERPYLDGKVVGLISTAGGDRATIHAVDTLVHTVHALRGTVMPLMVAIPKVWRRADNGEITDEEYGIRSETLGQVVVDTVARLRVAEDDVLEIRTVA
jgi:FMN reductase